MKEVQDRFDFMAARHPSGSMTVGIVCGPDLVWSKSYGYADVESGKTADRDTVYRIGSITKQFTGLMLLQLVDDGSVKLSDAVEKYFPDIRNVEGNAALAQPITLEQLATHRAGLSREPDDQRFLVGPVAEWEEITRSALPHVKYQFEPGKVYSYSNIGYAILGAALSRAADQPYTDYVQQHILSPLGMRHTGFEPNADMLARLAKGYVVVNDKTDPTVAAQELQTGRGYKVPNGALFTTIDDLAKFVSFEMGDGPEGILNPATLNENFARGYPTGPDTKTRCGIGYFLLQNGRQTAIGHSGSVAGYVAGAYFDPAARIGIVYLRSSIDRVPDEGALFGSLSLLAEVHKEVGVDTDLYRRYVGHYRLSMYSFLTVTRDGDHLFAEVGQQPQTEIFPESDRDYFAATTNLQLTFAPGDSTPATEVVLHVNGEELAGQRVDDAEADRGEQELADRVRNQRKTAGGEAALRRYIDELRAGQPDYARMSPTLANVTRDQLSQLRSEMVRLGPVASVSFEGVGLGGADIYQVKFGRRSAEAHIIVAADGTIDSCRFIGLQKAADTSP